MGLLMLFIALIVGGVGQDPLMHTVVSKRRCKQARTTGGS